MAIPSLRDLSMALLQVQPIDSFARHYKACFLAMEGEIAALPDHVDEPEEIAEARKRMAWSMWCFVGKVRGDREKTSKLFELHDRYFVELP